MPGWHRVFSNSSLDVTMPQDDVRCQGTWCNRDTSGPFAQWLYGGTEGCQQVQFAISISLWARSKHLLMSDGVWWFAVPWTRLWRDEVRDMVWHYITLLWQNPQSFCEILPLNVMTGCIRLSSRIHDWYKLQLPWCHLFEKKDIFQKFTAVLHRHKENKYRMSFFSAYTTRCCVKIWLTSEDIHFVA